MATRQIDKLDPDLVAECGLLLKEGKLTGQKIAKKLRINPRTVSEIKIHFARAARGATDPNPVKQLSRDKTPDHKKDIKDYQDMLRTEIPLRERVRAFRSMMKSSSDQIVMRAIERIDSIEGLNKEGEAKLVPMFEITEGEEPDLRKKSYVDGHVDTVELWIEDWKVRFADEKVHLDICLGKTAEDRTQTMLRGLHSGIPVGLVPQTKRKVVKDAVRIEEGEQEGQEGQGEEGEEGVDTV